MRVTGRPGVRTGGWSQSGDLTIGDVNKKFVTQVSFYDPDDPRQRPAGVYTVSFDVDTRRVNPAGLREVNPTAEVLFSIEGNTVRRKISVVNGTAISGVIDHVEVRVADETPAPVQEQGPTSLDYVVGITVAPFTRPPRIPPYLRGTVIPITLAGGANFQFAVPDNVGATSVLVLAHTINGGIPNVIQRTGDFANLALASYPPAGADFVPLFPRAAFIDLINNGAGGTSVDFSILFGIDG